MESRPCATAFAMACETAAAPFIARSTSGARLVIRYDRDSNSIVYVETGWSEDGRDVAARGEAVRAPLRPAEIVSFRRRQRH